MSIASLDWRPTATLGDLRQRAAILARMREFFAHKSVLEVETPLLCHATVTDPHVVGIPALFKPLGATEEQIVYLQTSPEYAMKRLLAAGSGPIYQMSKAFRQGEVGKQHNPEFTMLEWYRPGFDHQALMAEMDEFLQAVAHFPAAEKLSYAQAFERVLGINPHTASSAELAEIARQQHLPANLSDHNAWLDVLMVHCVEPTLGRERPVLLYDFPVSQAALAKIRSEDPPVASRFEVYFKGVEVANGFHELQDVGEQRQRFVNDLAYRTQHHLPRVEIDARFLAALQEGIPDCAGVALGVDRLMMLALNCGTIAEVLSFAFSNA